MFNVRLAGGHLYGKQMFTWLSLVVSFMVSFVLSFFPLDVLDGIWDLIESVSEGFLTYSFIFALIFYLILISMFLRYCTYEIGIFHANQTTKCLRNQGRTKGEGWSTAN